MLLVFYLCLISVYATAAETEPSKQTVVSLSASAQQNVANDDIRLAYRIEASGSKASALHKKVNRISHRIHQALQHEKGMKLNTLNRHLTARWHYDQSSGKQMRDGWMLVQQEELRSHRLDAIAAWVDSIEKTGGHISGLNYQVSESLLKKTQNQLRLHAIAQFRAKAANIAQALDAPSFQILRLLTDTASLHEPMQRSMPSMALMKAQEDAAPSLNSGESNIRITVSGEIALPKKVFLIK